MRDRRATRRDTTMFDRLDAVRPIASTSMSRAPQGDERRHPRSLIKERALLRQGDQRSGERRSGERRRGERRSGERRRDDRRDNARMADERRSGERRAADRRSKDRRQMDRRTAEIPMISLGGKRLFRSGWGRSRRPVIDDYA